MDATSDLIIIGAGIAGASAAYFSAFDRKVTVLEREDAPARHSTGRSAAQFTVGITAPTMRRMAMASRRFFEAPPAGFAAHQILSPRGCLTVAGAVGTHRLEALEARLLDVGAAAKRVDAAEAVALFPALRADDLAGGVLEPDAKDIDVDLLLQGYVRGARARGAVFAMDAGVAAIDRRDGLWRVHTTDGACHAAPVLVDAAGAWADEVARMAGVRPVGLVPHRRTAFTFAPPSGADTGRWPHVTRVGSSWYVKPEQGRMMGSLADATPTVPCDAQPEDIDVAQGIHNIEADTTLSIRRPTATWAGLRSFVADSNPVAGFAADAEGFFFLAGQGGCGILTSPAMGAAAAALTAGRELPAEIGALGVSVDDLSPARPALAAA